MSDIKRTYVDDKGKTHTYYVPQYYTVEWEDFNGRTYFPLQRVADLGTMISWLEGALGRTHVPSSMVKT